MKNREHCDQGEPAVVDSNVWESRLKIAQYFQATARKGQDAAPLFARFPDDSRFSGAGDGQLKLSDRGDLQIYEGGSWRLVNSLPPEIRSRLVLVDASIQAFGSFFQAKEQAAPYISPPPRSAADRPRAERSESVSASFEYNKIEAQRLGLEPLEINGNQKAQRFINDVVRGVIDIETDTGKIQFVKSWGYVCPDIPMPCVLKNAAGNAVSSLTDADLSESDFWYLQALGHQTIIQNLYGKPKPAIPRFDESAVVLVDNWQYSATNAAKMHRSKLVYTLLGNASTVNVSREDIDAALWQGDPADSVPTVQHKKILLNLRVNPDECELRCIRQDEYARSAEQKGWEPSDVSTHFHNYYFDYGSERQGLCGGCRDMGGASFVDCFECDTEREDLAVRLVLARKQK